ncbi:MAG: hypothetical protein ACT4OX_15395 [Actinomycetota bacterium]
MKPTNPLKRLLAVGVVAGVASVGLGAFGPAADATVNVGAINCKSTTILGPVYIRNPSVSHVTGPVWAARGVAATIINESGLTVLPRTVGPATIGSYEDLVNTSQIVGINGGTAVSSTAVTTGPVPGLTFFYDPDLADIPGPVPMNGVTTYPHALDGALGPFPAPTVVVTGPLPLVGVPGTFDITTTLDPGVGTLPTGSTPGNPGAGLFTPDVPISITSTVPIATATDGTISMVSTSTTLKANVTAPIVTSAVTSCGPSATPTHVINVQTDGAATTAAHPVIACDPTAGTGGVFKDSKGWWSQDTNLATAENYAGSLSGTTTWDGCIAPDTRLADWVLSKNGALVADSLALAKAAIAVKAKHFGNCTQVDEISAAGRVHAANSVNAYEAQGTVAAKWLTAANLPSKVKASTIYGAIRLVLDSSGGTAAPAMRLDAVGVVTKGAGIGGTATWVSEVDNTQAGALAIIACNAPGYAPPAVGSFPLALAPFMNLLTDVDAVLQINAP